jgi:hypothetical protein
MLTARPRSGIGGAAERSCRCGPVGPYLFRTVYCGTPAIRPPRPKRIHTIFERHFDDFCEQ